MKKKEEVSNIKATLFIILLILFAFGIIWTVINGILKPVEPEFTIYKEERRNEPCFAMVNKINDINFSFEITGVGSGIHIGQCAINYPADCKPNTKEFFGKIPEYICEGKFDVEICKKVEVKDNIIDWYYEGDWKNSCGKLKIGETVGIEWLDENCGCILCDTNGKNCVEDEQYCGITNKWKCGDYFVEVKQ